MTVTKPPDSSWIRFDEGVYWIGNEDGDFHFENESPRHREFVHSFELASRLVTNGEYFAFIEDGGYSRPEFWLSAGWDLLRESRWTAPLYWDKRDGKWQYFTLSGIRPIDMNEPVCHVNYFEADAFARWADARLPTEAEWEIASGTGEPDGNFVESGLFHPRVLAWPSSQIESPAQMFGDVWEWTRSPYEPYPGYKASRDALGEYNGKFMCNQYVLRGGSCVTSRSHIRRTYRNFFAPDKRWQFSGVRLARDIS
jgi:ergothioneine biosynthesis protein EgtB